MLPAEPFRRGAHGLAAGGPVAPALFALYAATAPRTVALEDDGLFILSSYFLGIEHPPGYPLFTLIGNLFTYLPFGSVAYRVHLASALFGALTCGVLGSARARSSRGACRRTSRAFALGLSPVFWSQAIIAEVYTLNTLFFLVLSSGCGVLAGAGAERAAAALDGAGFRPEPEQPLAADAAGRPGFCRAAVAAAPRDAAALRRCSPGWSSLGLLPYAWMVRRSWRALPISFDGPLETCPEIWFFLSRAGYAEVDHSASAGWLDRIKFFHFLGGQLLLQFAVLGTLLAAAGFAVQWRILGQAHRGVPDHRVPDAVRRPAAAAAASTTTRFASHVFHVYPLPAYAIGALWMGAGVRLAGAALRARAHRRRRGGGAALLA